jgi:hypothetical protein
MDNPVFKDIKTGLTGEIVDALSPLVESNSESLLIQLLACFGSCMGQTAYFSAAEDKHYCNLFVALVGRSARGRKGQSLNMIKELFKLVDSSWSQNRIQKGLSSGEGLISRVQNEAKSDGIFDLNLDSETKDKRLLCIESEFSSVLKMTQREGNILSQVLRDAWDSSNLQTMTRNNPLVATEPHISIIGHITFAEMTKYLSSTEINNGLGNRFIFIKAETNKKLPFSEPIPTDLKKYLSDCIKISLQQARNQKNTIFSKEASLYWEDFYSRISDSDETIVGALTAREAAQVRRLSMIIALLNGKNEIDVESLKFGEAIFNYSVRTLKEIYGVKSGDPLTDKIYDLLKTFRHGLSRSQLHESLSKNYQKGSLDYSLNSLKSQRLVDFKKIETEGRPQEIWYIIDNGQINFS